MQPNTISKNQTSNPFEKNILDELRNALGERNFNHWFRDKVSISLDDEILEIGVGNPFLLNWMQKHFRNQVSAAVLTVLGPAVSVQFVVDSSLMANEAPPAKSSPEKQQKKSQQKSEGPEPSRYQRRFADLADYVTGPCNEMALLAAMRLAEDGDSRYNPLFIHGGVGTGKTHLLEGIYRKIRRENPLLKSLYLTAENFTNYFTQALRERSLPGFRQRFRNIDILLIDDIGFFEGKTATQEEFLHTFQQLMSHNRQIVLTSDRHPRLHTKMSECLTTRFLSGLVCRIESPDLETRLAIIEHKVKRLNVKITPGAQKYVAQRFQTNIRELEGGLNCLATYHSMTGKTISQSIAQRVLAELLRDCIKAVRIQDVESAICDLFGIESADLKSSKRHRSVSQPRMLAMFLSRKLTRAAYSEIGAHFGGRNHSTVMSAERQVRKWISEEQTLKVAAQTWPLEEVLSTLEHQLQVG
ncbi:MAG: chromosomal replication initiator protein DnaA [Planctomycetaceae bacterium]